MRTSRDEAFAILRDLIERVSVDRQDDGVEIELVGSIVAMADVWHWDRMRRAPQTTNRLAAAYAG